MKKKFDLIIIGGAPGSGKTTIANLLKEKIESPMIDFGWLREFHLDDKWKKANSKEELMAFENLIFIVKNYLKKGYKNIILLDFKEDKIIKLAKIFSKRKFIIITLVVNENELKKRVLTETRDSGFRNVEKALSWNKRLKQKKLMKNEIKIDNSHNNPNITTEKILKILN